MKTFVGIDIAKKKHRVTIIDHRKVKLQSFWMENFHKDLQLFKDITSKHSPDKNEIYIGMESTGIYHIPLLFHLNNLYPNLSLIQPARIKAQRKSMGYEVKNDNICSSVIAEYVLDKEMKNNLFPVKYPKLRQLCRLRHKYTQYETRIKNRILGNLHQIFPEYNFALKHVFTKTSIKILDNCCVPTKIKQYSEKEFLELICSLATRIDKSVVLSIYRASQNSFGITSNTEIFQTEIKILLSTLKNIEEQIQKIEELILENFSRIHNPFEGVKGLSKISVATIISESEDINFFKNRNQYYKYTGLSPRSVQSGQFKSNINHITKCGNKYLRNALMQSSVSLSAHNSYFKKAFNKSIYENKKSKRIAYNIVAKKFSHIIYKLLKSKTDYKSP